MFDQVKIVMAGIERLVPRALLSAYKSFGWKEVQGADPVVEEKAASPASTVKTKEKKNAKIPQR